MRKRDEALKKRFFLEKESVLCLFGGPFCTVRALEKTKIA